MASASQCERNWSDFDFIWSRRRNKLKPERASDLVYVHSNSQAVRKFVDVEWDEEGEECFEWDEVEPDSEPEEEELLDLEEEEEDEDD